MPATVEVCVLATPGRRALLYLVKSCAMLSPPGAAARSRSPTIPTRGTDHVRPEAPGPFACRGARTTASLLGLVRRPRGATANPGHRLRVGRGRHDADLGDRARLAAAAEWRVRADPRLSNPHLEWLLPVPAERGAAGLHRLPPHPLSADR